MGTINDKLTYLNGTKTAIKNVMLDKGVNVSNADTFRSYASKISNKFDELEDIIDEEITTCTIEGTEIDIEDSVGWNGSIGVGGNTEQKQLSGKNKLDCSIQNQTINGVSFTRNEDGTIAVNGTATSGISIYINNSFIIYDPGQYKFSDGVENESSTTYFMYLDTRDINDNVTDNKNMHSFSGNASTFTEQWKGKARIVIREGQTLSNVVFKPMLRLSTEDDTYEQYCGGCESPNPDYPQKIQVVKGANVIRHVEENLFDSSFNMKTQYGVAVTYEDGIVTINGTSNNQGFVTIRNDLLNMLGIGNHTLIFQYISGTQDGGSIRFSFGNNNMSALEDNDNRHFSIVSTNNNNSNIVQVKDFDKVRKIMRWGVWINNNITFNNYKFRLYVVKGTYTANTIPVYEPYKEETLNLNLGTIELCKLGNYEDVLFKNVIGSEFYNAELEEGAWYKKNAIKKTVLDGSENWRVQSVNDNGLVNASTDAISSSLYGANFLGYSDKFSKDTAAIAYAVNEGFNNAALLYFYIRVFKTRIGVVDGDTNAKILAKFKTWLESNNTTVYSVLDEQTTTKITDPTLISQLEALLKVQMYHGVNHFYVETDNLEPNMELTYKRTRKYQNKSISPTTSQQIVTADSEYDALNQITVNAIQTESKTVKSTTSSQNITPTSGKFINKIVVNPISLESKTVTPTTSQQVITPTSGKDGISQVTVNAVTSAIDNNIQAGNIKKDVSILGVTGTLESGSSGVGWSEIGYSNEPLTGSIIVGGMEYAKTIYDNWDSSETDLSSLFEDNENLVYMPLVDTSNVTDMRYMFIGCSNLYEIPLLDTSNVLDMTGMFSSYGSDHPGGCPANLSYESFENVVQMCINATNYSGYKGWAQLGLNTFNVSDSVYYDDFINAGWQPW